MMLDQEAMEIARTRLSAESSRRHHFFNSELQRVQSELAAKGLGRSGALIQAIADVCAKDVENSTDELWELVRDLLQEEDAAPSHEAAEALHRQIDELWVPYCSALTEAQFEAICQRDGVSFAVKNATHFHDRTLSSRLRLHSQIDEFIRSKRKRFSVDGVPSNRGRNPKVFLSHAALDEQIALLLKAEVERRLPGVKVFCSSDPADLPQGVKWSPEIQQSLQESAMLILVASDRGLERPWVWFECGTFWFTDKKIMPLCLGEVRKNALRPPLSELQAVNGDESNDLKTGLDAIATATGSTVSDVAGLITLSQKLKELDREAAGALNATSGWLGAEWKGKFLVYDGPYESLNEIGDRNFETSMQEALKAAGYDVALYDKNNFAVMGDTNHFVHLTDRKSWRCRIAKGTAYLVATPT